MKDNSFYKLIMFFRRSVIRALLSLTRYKLFQSIFLKLTKGKYKILKFISIENANKIYPDRIEILQELKSEVSYAEPNYSIDDFKVNNLIHIDGFKNYTLKISDAIVTGCSSLIEIDQNSGIYELKYRDRNDNISLSDQNFMYYSDIHCIMLNTGTFNYIDAGILLGGNYSLNYYHLMFDHLVKFIAINELKIENEVPIIIDKVCTDVRQFKQIIDLLNINKREYFILDEKEKLRIKNLYYVSTPNLIPPNFRNEKKIRADDFLFQFDSIDYLRNKLLGYKSPMIFPRRIFLSRKNASGRREFNESEVFQAIQSHGFTEINVENLDINEQITLFADAEFIIGGSGAAFTNLIFCSKGCNIIILNNYKYPLSIFSSIGKYLNLNLIYFTDDKKSFEKAISIHDKFSINIPSLLNLIKEMSS